MKEAKTFYVTGERTLTKVKVRPMNPASVWDMLQNWIAMSDILEALEARFEREKESGVLEGMKDRLRSVHEQLAETRTELMEYGYEVLFKSLAGPIERDGTEYEPSSAEDLREVFSFLSADDMSDLYEMVSQILEHAMPDHRRSPDLQRTRPLRTRRGAAVWSVVACAACRLRCARRSMTSSIRSARQSQVETFASSQRAVS